MAKLRKQSARDNSPLEQDRRLRQEFWNKIKPEPYTIISEQEVMLPDGNICVFATYHLEPPDAEQLERDRQEALTAMKRFFTEHNQDFAAAYTLYVLRLDIQQKEK